MISAEMTKIETKKIKLTLSFRISRQILPNLSNNRETTIIRTTLIVGN